MRFSVKWQSFMREIKAYFTNLHKSDSNKNKWNSDDHKGWNQIGAHINTGSCAESGEQSEEDWAEAVEPSPLCSCLAWSLPHIAHTAQRLQPADHTEPYERKTKSDSKIISKFRVSIESEKDIFVSQSRPIIGNTPTGNQIKFSFFDKF